MDSPIGGYFELELPPPKPFLYPTALRFQSARAAFSGLLSAVTPSRILVPHYLCDSMLAPLLRAGVKCVSYSIDRDFNVIEDFDFHASDWLLYVNYFGVCANNIDGLLARYAPQQLILDYSQAFYATPKDCLATIYSPRKFFGVPDGGLLVTTLPIREPQESDRGSMVRALGGLTRLAETPEAGYVSYQQAEGSLEQAEPLKMSQLSQRILYSVDLEAARLRRNANFRFLHQHLGIYNALAFDLQGFNGPLCYPLLVDVAGLRAHLIRKRIFVATYWPEVASHVAAGSHEMRLVQNLLPLPCDQRYGQDEMARIVEVCRNFLTGS